MISKFNPSGLKEQAESWVGTGENKEIDSSQVTSALGNGTIAELASKFGLSHEDAAAGLAKILPELINQVTPDGTTKGSDGLISGLLSSFLK